MKKLLSFVDLYLLAAWLQWRSRKNQPELKMSPELILAFNQITAAIGRLTQQHRLFTDMVEKRIVRIEKQLGIK
jgi:hypothetical protein